MRIMLLAILAGFLGLAGAGHARTVVFDEASFGDFASQGTTLNLVLPGTYVIRGSEFSDSRSGGQSDNDVINLRVIAPLRVAGVQVDILSGQHPDDSYSVFYALTGTDRSGTNTLRRWRFDVAGQQTLADQRLRNGPFPQEEFKILSFFARGFGAERGLIHWDYQITVDVQEIAEVPLPAMAPALAGALIWLLWPKL